MPLQLENMHTTIPTDYNYTSGQTDDFIDNLQWDSFTSLYLNGPMWTQSGHWWSRTFQSASGNSHCYYNFLFFEVVFILHSLNGLSEEKRTERRYEIQWGVLLLWLNAFGLR